MAADCIFCSIVSGDIPADLVYTDAGAVAFRDVNPQAPVHLLVVPRTHVADIGAAGADPEVAVALLGGVAGVAAAEGLTDYRTVFNTGAGVGQSVFHVHAHVLAGRPMAWPPG